MRQVAALAFVLLLATQASAMGNYPPTRWHDARDSSPPSVPEPAAVGLFASGSAIIGWAIHRRRK
jgi:hypothetical protein